MSGLPTPRKAAAAHQSPSPIEPQGGVVVLSGYGLRIAVERGHLVVSDGIGPERREGRLNRATCGLKRLVVLGHSGTISLESLKWLADVGAAFVQLGRDGEVIIASGPSGLDDARLRRAQALAATNGVGIAIGRELLRSKLTGQAEVLTRLPESGQCIAVIKRSLAELETAETPAQLRVVEARAANSYWTGWSGVTIRFAAKDQFRLPAHWALFVTRSSAVTGTSRAASNPINATLNLSYAILEAEVRLAVIAMGLDPGMGILHADQKSRDSFVFDVLEPLRPLVDGYVLALLESRTFSAKEFFETKLGVCRLMPPMTRVLAELGPQLAKVVAPVVEQVAQRLAEGQGTAAQPLTVPTLLSQAHRSAGREAVRTSEKRATRAVTIQAPPACKHCGVLLEQPGREYCDECLPVQVASFSAAGRQRLAELRAAGKDPAVGGQAAKARAAKIKQRMAEQQAWEAEHATECDPEIFRREILPRLQAVSLASMAKATGLSVQYCSLIRRGKCVPHLRHWSALINPLARQQCEDH